LWEVFLVEKLNFNWDEIHPIAEELEHINFPELIRRLDQYLGHPKFDPHGDPIPDEDGVFAYRKQILLNEMRHGEHGVIVGVDEHSPTFLQYLEQMNLILGKSVKMLEKNEYDGSVRIQMDKDREQLVTNKVAKNLYVKKTEA